jgi:uncharacterized protein YfbU (UPF0304 family)
MSYWTVHATGENKEEAKQKLQNELNKRLGSRNNSVREVMKYVRFFQKTDGTFEAQVTIQPQGGRT